MALGTILPHGYVHEDERPCSHVPPAVLPGCTASGNIGASTRLWPPAPSWPLRRRGAGLAPALRAISTGEPPPRRCHGGTRR